MRTTILSGISLLGLIACSGAGAPSVDPAVASDEAVKTTTQPSAAEQKACEEAEVAKDGAGDEVVVCKMPFATAPLVRLPVDNVAGHTAKFYGGMTVATTVDDIAMLLSRDGARYVATDSNGTVLKYGADASKLPKGLHAPTNRLTFTLYQFTGTLGGTIHTPAGKARAITLTSARPVVKIDGCAFDSRLLGTWLGTVSERLETPAGGGPFSRAFDDTKRVPIHVTLAKASKSNNLQDYKGGARMSDAETYVLGGTIDNFDHDVSVDGTTYPSLTDMGKKNPFYGAKNGKISLSRLGNMHGLTNDGHWVFTYPNGSDSLSLSGMSHTLTAFTAPLYLTNGTAADDLQSLEIVPHIPFASNGHTLVLSPESIGGSTGQCEN